MARLLVLKTWTVLIALLPMAGPAWATDAGPKSSAPKDARKAPPDSKDKDSKLTCLLLCQQQQLGVRLEGNDRKLFQQCFAQALCSTELGPPRGAPAATGPLTA